MCIFAEVQNMTFKNKNTLEITFIRLQTYYTKKNKSFVAMLISIYSYDIKD